MTGDYDTFSRYLEEDAAAFVRRLPVRAGTRLLDVACGSGQVALMAARAGAQATGCDIAVNWIERARERAAEEGLAVRFDEGDAEELPYPSSNFDVVTSLFGAMFAPRPELVAAELTRVCRRGGIIAMGNWTPEGFIGRMFKTIAAYIAPTGMPSPVLWGDEGSVRQRLQYGIAELRLNRRLCRFHYPFAPAEVVEFFRENYGPMGRAFASLDTDRRKALRRDLVELWSAHNQGGSAATVVDGEYLEVVAVRA